MKIKKIKATASIDDIKNNNTDKTDLQEENYAEHTKDDFFDPISEMLALLIIK